MTKFHSPLHDAVWSGDPAAVEERLAAGDPIDGRVIVTWMDGSRESEVTALMVAATGEGGCEGVEIVDLLLRAGADPLAHNAVGETAAWYAARGGFRLDHGGRPGPGDPVHGGLERLVATVDAAAKHGVDVLCWKYVHHRGGVEVEQPGTRTPKREHLRPLLTVACERGDPARVAELLRRGALVAPTRPRGIHRLVAYLELWDEDDPLFAAVRADAVDCIPLLLKAGAEAHCWSFAREATPLMEARSVGAVRALIAGGAEVNARSVYRKTALMTQRNPDALRALLEAGADPFARDVFKADAMSHQLRAREVVPECVDVLVAAGVSLDDYDKHGMTRFARYLALGCVGGANALLDRGASPNVAIGGGNALTVLCAAPFHDDEDPREIVALAQRLVAAGVDPRIIDEDGDTALHLAASSGHVDLTDWLIDAGLDIEARDAAERTPLMDAALAHEPGAVETLLRRGADATARDVDGATALGLVAATLLEDHPVEHFGRALEISDVLDGRSAEAEHVFEILFDDEPAYEVVQLLKRRGGIALGA